MNNMEEFSDVIFWKVEGSGNDFIIIDGREPATEALLKEYETSALVQRLCTRRLGVGADGAVIVKKSDKADFAWEFYNNDGSRASMCGNASRCVGLWGCLHVTQSSRCSFETDMGVLTAEVSDDSDVEVQIPIPSFERTPFDIGLMYGAVQAHLVNVGVPHIVVEMNEWPVRSEQTPKIASLRRHSSLGSEGANVTFFAKKPDGSLKAVTYERGVEDFTLSCGTGVMASALVHGEGSSERISVTNPGGTLSVRFDRAQSIAYLGGPAAVIFKAFLNKEILN